jgi:hypothetical protein
MFSLTLMSKGEKRSGPNRMLQLEVQTFSATIYRVAINAKGGDCWHVYRQSVLVIDGKIRVCIDGKNNSNDGMIIGRMCQAGTRSLLEDATEQAREAQRGIVQELHAERKYVPWHCQRSEEIAFCAFQKCSRGPREGLVGGAKVKTLEHLENLLSQRDQKSQEEERQWPLDHQSRIPDDH